MFSEQIFTKVFEKSFNDEVDYTDRKGSLIYFKGEVYSMKYNCLNKSIAFFDRFKDRIGTVFLHSGSDIFFEIDPSTPFGYHIVLFKHELEKYIELNQKKTRRKFISR